MKVDKEFADQIKFYKGEYSYPRLDYLWDVENIWELLRWLRSNLQIINNSKCVIYNACTDNTPTIFIEQSQSLYLYLWLREIYRHTIREDSIEIWNQFTQRLIEIIKKRVNANIEKRYDNHYHW